MDKECYSKRWASYCVTVTNHLYYVNYQMGHQEGVTVEGSFLYCVTVTSVTSGQTCIVLFYAL